jgi:ABC-type polysaccharide/polyol phosphate export permease
VSAARRLSYDSAHRPAPALAELNGLIRMRGAVAALAMRDLKIRYRRSVLGIAWTMVQPALMLVMFTLVFTTVFETQAPFYPGYLLPGLLLWYFFSQTTAQAVAATAQGVDLWRRIRIPRTALPVATLLTGIVNLGFGLLVLLVILIVAGRPLGPALLTVPYVVGCTALFALGVMLAVSAAAFTFPDVAEIYQVLLLPLLFATPIMYPLDILPATVRGLAVLNPLTLFVEAFRAPLYEARAPDVGHLAAIAAVGAAALLLGWLVYSARSDAARHRD